MRLIILGNGFDVGHGIPSRFSDFGLFVRKQKSLFKSESGIVGYRSLPEHAKRVCDVYPWMASEPKAVKGEEEKEDLWSRFEELTASPNEDEFKKLGALGDYWEDIYLDIFETDLVPLFRKWASQLDGEEWKSFPGHSFRTDDLFLTFNYTKTLENRYKESIDINNVFHIHGIGEDAFIQDIMGGPWDSKLIFGHSTSEECWEEQAKVYGAGPAYQKFFKATGKDTRSIIENDKANYDKRYFNGGHPKSFFGTIKEKASMITKVIVLGCSYSDVDFDYFREIYDILGKNKATCFLGHGEDDCKRAENYAAKLGLTNFRRPSRSDIIDE